MQNLNINNRFQSPNYSSRLTSRIDTLVIHYTEMKSAEAAIERLCDPIAAVSAHYVIAKSGEIFGLVNETAKAHHAGVSYWRGREKVNDFSIGIELDNNGKESFSTPLMNALIKLCHHLIGKYSIEPHNIVGHSDIAPLRKTDPGIFFEWNKLAENAIGIMPQMELFTPPRQATEIHKVIQLLAEFGYNREVMIANEDQLAAHLDTFSTHYLGEKYQLENLAKIEFALENMLKRIG